MGERMLISRGGRAGCPVIVKLVVQSPDPAAACESVHRQDTDPKFLVIAVPMVCVNG